MRGKECSTHCVFLLDRITPAYAGKRRSCVQYLEQHWDHPRLCGEKMSRRKNALRGIGSPPPMRGKAEEVSLSAAKQGITPAYAGKSKYAACQNHTFQDHPRLCGEKLTSSTNISTLIGSPPPMRGKVDVQCDLHGQIGITPAYAGKSA